MTLRANERIMDFGSDLSPGYDVVIYGKDGIDRSNLFQDIRHLIESIEVEDDEEMMSQMVITIINQPETNIGQPSNWRAVIDSKAFQEGNQIEVYMGYGNNRTFMDRFEVVKWLPPFSEEGNLQFTIKAYDGRHRMTQENKKVKGKRKCFYKNLADHDIVIKIGDKYKFEAEVDVPTARKKPVTKIVNGRPQTQYVYPTRVQTSDTTDLEFLQKLANINNFDLWIDYDRVKKTNVIHFKERPFAGSAKYEFDYNNGSGSLLSCIPDFSIKNQSTSVEVLRFDKQKREIVRTVIVANETSEDVSLSGKVSPGRLQARQEIGTGASVRFTAFGQVIEAFVDRPFCNTKQAEQFVQQWLRERERDFLVVSGEVIGVEDLRSKQIHLLSGMSARLDGFYRFTNVKHKQKVGDLYTCEFTAHKILSQGIVRRKTKVPSRSPVTEVIKV